MPRQKYVGSYSNKWMQGIQLKEIQRKLLKAIIDKALIPDVCFLDEAHFGSGGNEAKEIYKQFDIKTVRILMTATYRRPYYLFDQPTLFYWDYQDIQFGKRLNNGDVFKAFRKKHLIEGEDPESNNTIFDRVLENQKLRGSGISEIQQIYSKFPDIETIDTELEETAKEVFAQQLLDDSSKGFSPQLTFEALQKEPAPPAGVIANANTLDLPSTGSPQMCRGNLTGTLIAQTNAAVIHSCDIATQLKRSVLWEKLKHSRLVQAIRDAIEAIKKALGFSPDAVSQRYIEIAQWIAGKLKTLSEMLKEFNDWAAISIEYVKILRAIIDWIMSLPARLKAALQECLQQFLKGITSAVSDVLSLPGAENTPENASLTDALKDVKTNFESLAVQTKITLQLPSQVLTAITTPASSKDIAALDSVVADFISDKAKENENVITDPLNSMTLA